MLTPSAINDNRVSTTIRQSPVNDNTINKQRKQQAESCFGCQFNMDLLPAYYVFSSFANFLSHPQILHKIVYFLIWRIGTHSMAYSPGRKALLD